MQDGQSDIHGDFCANDMYIKIGGSKFKTQEIIASGPDLILSNLIKMLGL